MKIRATCTVEYDPQEVLKELNQDYPDGSWDMDYAKGMIHQWIKDDFGCILMEYKVEEING